MDGDGHAAMGDGALEWEPIEFIDSDSDSPADFNAGSAADAGPGTHVAWVDGDEVLGGRDLNDGRLPPRTTPNRVAATLLALGLFLAGLGLSGSAAYDRHLADRRIANILQLESGPGAPSIPGLTQLAFASVWQAQVPEQVTFPVVNRSPKPVTLVSAELSESGLISSSPLTPVGNRLLAPGQSGTLGGTVIADCMQATGMQTVILTSGGLTADEFTTPKLSVTVRTSGGTTGTAPLDPEVAGEADLQQRICDQQGNAPVSLSGITATADPDTRTITLSMDAGFVPTVAVDYSATATYSDAPADHVPGLILSTRPTAVSPAEGVLTPTGDLSLTYVIKVSGCPTGTLPQTDRVDIRLDMSRDGRPLRSVLQSTDLDSLIGQACGDT
jgi:hypothetical protein